MPVRRISPSTPGGDLERLLLGGRDRDEHREPHAGPGVRAVEPERVAGWVSQVSTYAS